MDAAYNLFNQIRAQGEMLITQMVHEGEQESLVLDFKTARNQSAPMQEDDRKTLAEAISGFSNADGGVIIWGIDCRKGPTPDDPDQAQSVKPISNLHRWLSDLNQYTHQGVSPQVIGVEHFIIIKTGEMDVGYAVTYIPKSVGQPVMAVAKKKEQYSYFIRSGASFVKMESFMVADRFQRRPQPKLELTYRAKVTLSQHRDRPEWYDITLIFGIINIGLGIALYPALELQRHHLFTLHSQALDTGGRTGLRHRPPGYHQNNDFFAGGSDDVIYPGQTLDVAGYIAHLEPVNAIQVTTFEYRLYCDGFSEQGSIQIGLEEVVIKNLFR
jgi:hypothetical protein